MICGKIRCLIGEKIAIYGLPMFDYYVCMFFTTHLNCFSTPWRRLRRPENERRQLAALARPPYSQNRSPRGPSSTPCPTTTWPLALSSTLSFSRDVPASAAEKSQLSGNRSLHMYTHDSSAPFPTLLHRASITLTLRPPQRDPIALPSPPQIHQPRPPNADTRHATSAPS